MITPTDLYERLEMIRHDIGELADALRLMLPAPDAPKMDWMRQGYVVAAMVDFLESGRKAQVAIEIRFPPNEIPPETESPRLHSVK